jgi:hypothetical protein
MEASGSTTAEVRNEEDVGDELGHPVMIPLSGRHGAMRSFSSTRRWRVWMEASGLTMAVIEVGRHALAGINVTFGLRREGGICFTPP